MPADPAEVATNNVARFNVAGRTQPHMGAGSTRGDKVGNVKPRVARQGYIRFLTLRDLDGRSRAAARCNELVRAFESDLGGADQLTTAQRQLVQRAALCATLLEDFEVRHTLGEPIELSDYLTCVNVQRRVLATLGLSRVPRNALAIDGTGEEVFSPMRSRWAAEAAAAAKESGPE